MRGALRNCKSSPTAWLMDANSSPRCHLKTIFRSEEMTLSLSETFLYVKGRFKENILQGRCRKHLYISTPLRIFTRVFSRDDVHLKKLTFLTLNEERYTRT